MKFDNEADLKVYQDASPHREYQAATAEQTAGMFHIMILCAMRLMTLQIN